MYNKSLKPEILREIKKLPCMGFIFLKAFFVAPFRLRTIEADTSVKKSGIVLKNFIIEKKAVSEYRKVCFFSEYNPCILPITYLQTIFTSLLGKFITSSFFPVSPLGLIHIFQSCAQSRAVKTDERLDLVCTLESIVKTDKGIETVFALKALSCGETVWHGISVFLIKKKPGSKKKQFQTRKNKSVKYFEHVESFSVPSDTGRKYALVSGDYNPHHIYPLFAKMFGFRRAIAHGMWSLARVAACLDKQFIINGPAEIKASFKLPVFMPATINLGYENHYELRKTPENKLYGNKLNQFDNPFKHNAGRKRNIIDFTLFSVDSGQNFLPHLGGKLIL